MLKINTSVLALTIVFMLSGCFGDTETHRANEGKPDTGASVHMKREEDRSGATMSGIPND
jgi:uncharacterized protein YceK